MRCYLARTMIELGIKWHIRPQDQDVENRPFSTHQKKHTNTQVVQSMPNIATCELSSCYCHFTDSNTVSPPHIARPSHPFFFRGTILNTAFIQESVDPFDREMK